MRLKVYWMLLLALVVVFPNAAAPVNAQRAAPHVEKTDCKFDIPQGTRVDCGYLIVPEDRTVVNSPTIRIFFARFHARNPKPQLAPVVFLDGGPGVHSLDWMVKTRPLAFV